MSPGRGSLLVVMAVAAYALPVSRQAAPSAWADSPPPGSPAPRKGAFETFQAATNKKIKTLRCFPKADERKCVRSISGPFVITDVLFRAEWIILLVAPDAAMIQEEGYIPRWMIDRNGAFLPGPFTKLFLGDIHGHFVVGPGETLFLAAPDPGDLYDVTVSGFRPD